MNERGLERLDAADLAELLAMTESAGWPHTPDDWRSVLHAGAVFGHRSRAGVIVSTAALFSYGPALAAIGMVIVQPDWRRRGLAKVLMQYCLAVVPNTPTILISTPYGLPLYQRLGFKTIAHVFRMLSPDPLRGLSGAPGNGRTLAPLRDGEVAAVQRLDADVIGADWSLVLEARLAYARCASVLRGPDGVVIGFALAMPQRDLVLVGPVIAPDAGAASALVADVVAGHDGPIRIDVTTDQKDLLTGLTAAGFSAADEAPVMIHGAEAWSGDRARMFAVVNRAFC